MGFKISKKPNTEKIQEAVKNNDGFCPCKLEKIDCNKCICQEFLAEEFEGDCECGLYTKTFINNEK